MSILVLLAGVYLLHLLLKMNWIATVVTAVCLLLGLQKHKALYRRMKEENLRFEETSEYLDTLLYAFGKEEKAERALADTEAAMEDGPLRELVWDALDHIHMTFDDTDVMRDSLKIIEAGYPCSRIKSVHDFMIHVENYGGEIIKQIELLLSDKRRWEERVRVAMQERKKMFTDIVLSVAASLVICCMILHLPVMNVDVTKSAFSQILTVAVLLLDDLILMKAQKYLAQDWIVLGNSTEPDGEQRIRSYYQYNKSKDKRMSVILSIPVILLTGYFFFCGKQMLAAIGVFGILLMVNQHKIGRHLAKKNIVKSIRSAFPGWLMDMILLLQSENVQVALMKSMQHVPGILAWDLQLLLDRLPLEPESAEPYHAFLQDFRIPEVHSAMRMLYSISMGHSAKADEQIGELVGRNLKMLDEAETQRLKDLNSGMYLLFLAPIVTASVKLLADMAVFMLAFLAGAGFGG